MVEHIQGDDQHEESTKKYVYALLYLWFGTIVIEDQLKFIN